MLNSNDLKQLDELFGEHKYPCLLADIKTHKILYINHNMEKLLQTRNNQTPILGQRFYDVIKNHNVAFTNDIGVNWDIQDRFHFHLYDQSLDQNFHVTHSKISLNNNLYNFSKYKPTATKETLFEEAMSRCIQALQETDGNKHNTLLESLGSFYQADHALLCQIDRPNNLLPTIAHWTSLGDDHTPQLKSQFQNHLDPKFLIPWFDTRNEIGILELSKALCVFQDLHSDSLEYQILNTFNLDNLAIAIIEDSHQEALRLLVLANRKNLDDDFRLLQSVVRFIEKDISNLEMEETVSQLHHTDLLTGFFNRISYGEKLDDFQKNPPNQLGVLFANVNGLKKINVEYGYANGDAYIKKAADFLKSHLSSPIYRISGDEFIIFFPNTPEDTFENMVAQLQSALKEHRNHYFSIGHAWQQGHIAPLSLIKEADTVMYINKQEYYHSSNRKFNEISDSTLSDLLTFLDNDEFMIYLQPQLHLKDSSLYGAEALIRRYDKTNKKMVFPDQFIPLYEQKSIIRHIDIFVVETVCKLLADWIALEKQIPISVNLSRVTLLEYDIVDTISNLCDKYHVPHELLIIEVTERVGLIENNVASSLIAKFKEKNFRISLDDFGCAYSNIVTLAQIEVDEVKIDKSLVDFLVSNPKNKILVKNVLSMCNELEGASTLAEGIEDQEQANLLHQLGCHLGQGYFYSRPIPIQEFVKQYIQI